MRYQSIIRFFDYAHIEYTESTTFNSSRAKKLVNAEFAMQPDGIIDIDGFSYTKQDLLSELEHPAFSQRLEQHKRIWDNKPLLELLEKDKVNLSQKPAWFHLAYAPHFAEFVSPYFAPVFDRVMRAILANNNLLNAALWLDYLPFVAPEDQEEALRSTRMYLSEASRFFKNLNDESYKTREGELYKWHHYNWSAFINKLPDSLLGYVDELISSIINFTVRIQKSNRTLCYELSKEMLLVNNANFSLRQLVRSNHETYKKNYESRTVKGYFSSMNYIYVIIVVIFWVARIIMSNSSSGKEEENVYDFKKPFEQQQTQQPTQQQEQQTAQTLTTNNQFALQRNAYMRAYRQSEKKGFRNMDATQLKPVAFNASKIYLFIEGHNSGARAIDTIAFENFTSKDINVDYIWAGNAYHHTISAGNYAGFVIAKDKNIDFTLDYQPEKQLDSIAQKDFQYIHLRKDNQRPFTDLETEIGTPGELPYFLHSELAAAPVYIKITEREGKLFLDAKTEAKVVNMKTAAGQ